MKNCSIVLLSNFPSSFFLAGGTEMTGFAGEGKLSFTYNLVFFIIC